MINIETQTNMYGEMVPLWFMSGQQTWRTMSPTRAADMLPQGIIIIIIIIIIINVETIQLNNFEK